MRSKVTCPREWRCARSMSAPIRKAESPEITGRSDDDHDFGTIRLVGTGARVAGQVVDTAGKPVAGATVFNRGDAPEASTDSRTLGAIPVDRVRWRVIARYWPAARAARL